MGPIEILRSGIEEWKGTAKLRETKRSVKTLKRATKGYTQTNANNLDFCTRPGRELWNAEREFVKKVGGISELTKHSTYARAGLSASRSDNAVGLFYGSAHFLEHRSHRFTLTDDGEISYHREAFHVDFQSLPSKPINLTGEEAIAENDAARTELRWLADQLAFAQVKEWQHIGKVAVTEC